MQTRPSVSCATAVEIALNYFGLKIAQGHTPHELPSYIDRNFCLLVSGTCSGETKDIPVILKVLNATDSLHPDFISAQNKALKHLKANGIPCNVLLPTLTGSDMILVNINGSESIQKEECLVRCFEFIPGTPIGELKQVPSSLYYDIGQTMAYVSLVLSDFQDPALHLTHEWSFETAAEVIKAQLENAGVGFRPWQKSLISWAVQLWEQAVHVQHRAGLRRQVCHGDANEMNLLIHDENDCRIAALLDFGDMSYTYTMSEVAITLVYAMLLAMKHHGTDVRNSDQDPRQDMELVFDVQSPTVMSDTTAEVVIGIGEGSSEGPVPEAEVIEAALEAGRAVMAGYASKCTLSIVETQMLPMFIAMRLSLSLTKGVASALRDPSNASYLLMTQRHGWSLLSYLHATHHSSSHLCHRLGITISGSELS